MRFHVRIDKGKTFQTGAMKGFSPCLTSGPRINRDVRKLAQTSRPKKNSVQFNNLENRCHQENIKPIS